MSIDTADKRFVVAGVPFLPLGVNVVPGTTGTLVGRAAAAWNFVEAVTPPGPGGGEVFSFGLGQKHGLTDEPVLGGGGSL